MSALSSIFFGIIFEITYFFNLAHTFMCYVNIDRGRPAGCGSFDMGSYLLQFQQRINMTDLYE